MSVHRKGLVRGKALVFCWGFLRSAFHSSEYVAGPRRSGARKRKETRRQRNRHDKCSLPAEPWRNLISQGDLHKNVQIPYIISLIASKRVLL